MTRKTSMGIIVVCSILILVPRLVGYIITVFETRSFGSRILLNTSSLQVAIDYSTISTLIEIVLGMTLFVLLTLHYKNLAYRTRVITSVPWIFLVFSIIIVIIYYFPEMVYSFVQGAETFVAFEFYDIFSTFSQIILPTGILLMGYYFLRRSRALFIISYGIYAVSYISAIIFEILLLPLLSGNAVSIISFNNSQLVFVLRDIELFFAILSYLLFVVALLNSRKAGFSVRHNDYVKVQTSPEEQTIVVFEDK